MIFVLSFRALGRAPGLADCALAAVFFAAAVTALYSLWLLVVCTAFHAVKIDNAADLLNAVFDAARWPSSVFRGAVRFVVTFVVPPRPDDHGARARALLGHLDVESAVSGVRRDRCARRPLALGVDLGRSPRTPPRAARRAWARLLA